MATVGLFGLLAAQYMNPLLPGGPFPPNIKQKICLFLQKCNIRCSLLILFHSLAILQAPSCTSGTRQPGPQVGRWGWEKPLFWLQWWPGHLVSKASCSSKSIQKLSNIQILLSAVHTVGARTLRVLWRLLDQVCLGMSLLLVDCVQAAFSGLCRG